MKVFINLLCFLLLLIVTACNHTNKNNSESIKIRVDDVVDSHYNILEENPGLVVPLETKEESLLGQIDKVLCINDSLYIMDNRKKEILVFKLSGEFIRKFNNVGKGEGEYLRISDFSISKNKLYVLSSQKNILVYRLSDFSYLEKTKRIKTNPSYLYVSDNKMLVSDLHLLEDEYKIVAYKNMDIEKPTVQYFEHEYNLLADFGGNKVMIKVSKEKFQMDGKNITAVYNNSLDNNIYLFKADNILDTFHLNFEDYEIPQSVLNEGYAAIEKYRATNKNRVITNCFYSNNILLAIIEDRNPNKNSIAPIHLFYNKKTGKTNCFLDVKSEQLCDNNINVISTYSDGFIGVLNYTDLMMTLRRLEEKGQKGNELTNYEKSFVEKFNENSNPVLILFNIVKH